MTSPVEKKIQSLDLDTIVKDLKDIFKDFLKIICLDNKTIEKVSKDKNITKYAYSIIIVTYLLQAIFMSLVGFSVPFVGRVHLSFSYNLISSIIYIIVSIGFIYLFSFLIDKLFHKKSNPDVLIRVFGVLSIFNFMPIFYMPFLFLIYIIFVLIILYKIVNTLYKLSVTQFLVNSIISLIIMVIFMSMLQYAFGISNNYNFLNQKKFNMSIKGADNSSVKFSDTKMEIKGKDGELINIKLDK